MNQNKKQIWNKTSYKIDKKQNLWNKDSFIRKNLDKSNSNYLMKEVYSNGLSTHLFDRNTGIYAYQKKGIETKNTSFNSLKSSNERNVVNIQKLSKNWKTSLKKLKFLIEKKGE